jgi:hypothetical protein
LFVEIFSPKFPNRTAAAQHDATSPNARRLGVVGMPSSEPSFPSTILHKPETDLPFLPPIWDSSKNSSSRSEGMNDFLFGLLRFTR